MILLTQRNAHYTIHCIHPPLRIIHYTIYSQLNIMKEQDQLISFNNPANHHYIEITDHDLTQTYEKQMSSLQLHPQHLIDLMGEDEPIASKIKLNNYMQFLLDRKLQVQKPELVKQGYLTSYKLYKIKSRKDSSQASDTVVSRRFNDFQFLHHQLIENYGGYVLPRLPLKNFLANLNLETAEFQQLRTKELLRYLEKLLQHPLVRFSNQLKHFLFDEEFNFSEAKGEFIEQTTVIDNLKNVTGTVYGLTKSVYQLLSGGKERTAVEFSRNAGEQQELKLFEHEIEELQKVTQEIKGIIDSSFREFSIIHDWTIDSNKSHLKSMQLEQQYLREYEKLIGEFEDIASFIDNCRDAINRTKQLRGEIEELQQQQAALLVNEKQNSRNRQLDIVRNKLQKANAKSEKWVSSLKKQLSVYTSEGKTMMQVFVKKYTKLRGEIYAQS